PKESAYYKYADTQGKIGDMAYAALEVLNQQAHKDIGLKGHCCERLMVKITDDWREFRKNIQ
ncbi:TPA: hypothetical protein ACHFP7_000683, partial [Enterobacter hormaechei]